MTATTEQGTNERGLAPELVYLRRAQQAKERGRKVVVRFVLDDGKTYEHWRVSVGRIEHDGFWTPGNFFIAYKRIEENGLVELEEQAA